jgi:Ca2+-transporting ATPase
MLLLPVHLIYLELVLHPFVALVFENDPPNPHLMERRPRRPGVSLLTGTDWRLCSAYGLLLSLGVLLLYGAGLRSGSEAEARALAFAGLVVGQVLLVLVIRSPDRPLWRADWSQNRTLAPIVISVLLSLVILVAIGPVSVSLSLAPLTLPEWLAAAGVAAAAVVWREPWKQSRSTVEARST